MVQGVVQTNACRCLTFACRGRSDSGDKNQLAVIRFILCVNLLEVDLGLVVAKWNQ